MRIHPLVPALATLAAALAVAACGRPAESPSNQTHTTSGVVQDPSYGNSDSNGWSDPAASGNANHGSATMGATTPLPPLPPPTQPSPVIVIVTTPVAAPDGGT